MISSLNVPERVETRNRLVVMDGGLQPVLTANQSSNQPGKKRCMAWLRIEAGHYESVNPKKYTIRREGTGLFKEGWRPSWRLRWKGSTIVHNFATLREAKAKAQRLRGITKMGKKRFLRTIKDDRLEKYFSYITAVHEAGHMLVERLKANRRIISATCVPGDDYAGYVLFADPQLDSVAPEMAKGMIMTGLAGDVAVNLVFKTEFDPKSLNETDRAALLEYGPDLCGSRQLDELAQCLAEETLELLRSNQESLRLLADTLRRMGNLTGRQIGSLLRRITPAP